MTNEEQTFSAKQVARRIGTDAKTFRKWLRSPASPYEAVGQGKRYEFPKIELREIDKLFHAWHDKGSKVNGTPTNKELEAKQLKKEELSVLVDMVNDQVLDELETEPTDEELEELGLEDLDLEDL